MGGTAGDRGEEVPTQGHLVFMLRVVCMLSSKSDCF